MFSLVWHDAASPLAMLEIGVRQEVDGAVVVSGRDLGVKVSPPAAGPVSRLDLFEGRAVARIGLEPDCANGLVSSPVGVCRPEVRVEDFEDGRVGVEVRLEKFSDLNSDVRADIEVNVEAAVELVNCSKLGFEFRDRL